MVKKGAYTDKNKAIESLPKDSQLKKQAVYEGLTTKNPSSLYNKGAYKVALGGMLGIDDKPAQSPIQRASFEQPKQSLISKIGGGISKVVDVASSPAGQRIIAALYAKRKGEGGLDFANALSQQATTQEANISSQNAAYNQALNELAKKQIDITAAEGLEEKRRNLELTKLTAEQTQQMTMKEADIAAAKALKELELKDKPYQPKTAAEEISLGAQKASAEAKAKLGIEQGEEQRKLTEGKPVIEATAGRIASIGGKAEKKLSSLGYKAQLGLSKFPIVGKYLKPKDELKIAVDAVKSELGTLEGVIPEYVYRNMVKSLNADDVDISSISAIRNKIKLYAAAK